MRPMHLEIYTHEWAMMPALRMVEKIRYVSASFRGEPSVCQ
jgi:hypothetical protein